MLKASSFCVKPFFCLAFLTTFFPIVCSAQVLDMRAMTRQQGYRANSVPQVYQAPVSRAPSVQTSSNFVHQPVQQEASSTGFRQSGLKIFQPKDEKNVMNFKVENPEFDKLSKSEQDDILSRIIIKQVKG